MKTCYLNSKHVGWKAIAALKEVHFEGKSHFPVNLLIYNLQVLILGLLYLVSKILEYHWMVAKGYQNVNIL